MPRKTPPRGGTDNKVAVGIWGIPSWIESFPLLFEFSLDSKVSIMSQSHQEWLTVLKEEGPEKKKSETM